MLRHTRVECLDVKCARFLKGVASVALGISSRVASRSNDRQCSSQCLQGDLPVWIFRPTSDRPGIDAENLSDRVDVS